VNSVLFLYIFSLYIFTFLPNLNQVSNLIAGVFILLVCIKILLQKKKIIFINSNKFLLFYFLFIIICIISYFYSLEPIVSAIKIKTLSLYFIFIIALVNYVDDYDKLTKLTKYFIYSGSIASSYILFNFLLNYSFSYFHRLGRLLGPINAMGIIIGIATIFSFYFLVFEKKYFYILPIIVTTIVILLTGSRTALAFVVLNVLLLIYFKNRRSFKGKLKTIILILLLFLLFYYLIFNVPIFYMVIGRRIENITAVFSGEGTKDVSISIRNSMIKFGIEKFIEKPILGYGIDNYMVLLEDEVSIRGYAHNNYIELLVDVGIVGTVIYYLMYVFSLFKLIKLKIEPYKNFKYLFISLFLSILIIGYSFVYYYNKHFYILLAMASVLVTRPFSKKILSLKGIKK